jgi:nicotinamidase-related amidase
LAVLDALCLHEPLDPRAFAEVLDQIASDPRGPFGEVLRRLPVPAAGPASEALLVIDPQRAFTRGVWMRSIGPGGERDVEPIRRGFEACARRVASSPEGAPLMVSRCPFPPGSYGWDPAVAEVLAPDQPYFIKPGNSILWPPDNGFRRWVSSLLEAGCRRLVIGGCTLTSCVRVSAVETQRAFGEAGLEVVVDLDLSAARADNYRPSHLFGGRSPVEAATDEIREAGVTLEGTGVGRPRSRG